LRLIVIALALLVLHAIPMETAAETLRIAREGVPVAVIVIPDNPSTAELWAANDLKYHLDRIIGGQFRIVKDSVGTNARERQIHVGATSFAGQFKSTLGPEAFTIRTLTKRIGIVGGSDSGTVFGAYEFLERLGVRWLVPGTLGIEYPHKPTLEAPVLNETQAPAFELRGLDGGLWGLRNKTNFITDATLPISATATPLRRIHTMDFWLPPDSHYAAHPDYYALVGGSRDPYPFITELKPFWKVEPGNPEVAEVVAERICAMHRADPEAIRFLLSPNDGLNFSESPESLALDEAGVTRWRRYSRRYILFYIAVAQQVYVCAPNVSIVGYAYHFYNLPPLDQQIFGPPNLSLMVARYTPFDYARSFEDPYSEGSQLFREALDGWEHIVGKRMYTFEYYWKLNWYGLPWPILHTIERDIPYLWARGIGGLLSQADLESDGWTNGLNFYVAAKLLWNPQRDPQSIKGEWMRGMFHESAPHMQRYYDVMEQSMASQTEISGNARLNALRVFTPSVLVEMRQSYDAAMAVATDERVIRRLRLIGRSLNYTERLVAIIRLAASDPARAAELLKQMIDEHTQFPNKWRGVVPDDIFGDSYLRAYLRALSSEASQ
jgi:hypothetical protein